MQESSEITGIPARVDPRLIEQNFGKYESTARNGEEFQKAKQQFITRYDGGESMLHLAQRIYNLLDEIKEESDHKTYILVAHNGISRVIPTMILSSTGVCSVWIKSRIFNSMLIILTPLFSKNYKCICMCRLSYVF